MKKSADIHPEKKQIKDLTQHEVDMIYSLVRIGDWPDSEIGRVYELSEGDVRTVFDNYESLLEESEKNPCMQNQPRQDPSQQMIEKKPRKRRDAIYATPAERQAAYRARLQESRNTVIAQPSPVVTSDKPDQAAEELSVT